MVLGDLRFSRAAGVGRDEPRTTPQQIGGGILSMDSPDHSRLRRLVAKAFTARRVEGCPGWDWPSASRNWPGSRACRSVACGRCR